MKLNIGCGKDKREGYINIDIDPKVNPNKVVNIENGLPFRSNTFDYILCLQILEHVFNIYFVMSEIHRVGKNHAKVEIEVPYYKSKVAYTCADHKRFFTDDTFRFFKGFKVLSIKKYRGRLIPWHIHGLKIILEVQK